MRKELWRDVIVSFWIVGMTGVYLFYGLSYLSIVQSLTTQVLLLFDRIRAVVW